mgnify:CR=1 FL=1
MKNDVAAVIKLLNIAKFYASSLFKYHISDSSKSSEPKSNSCIEC